MLLKCSPKHELLFGKHCTNGGTFKITVLHLEFHRYLINYVFMIFKVVCYFNDVHGVFTRNRFDLKYPLLLLTTKYKFSSHD